jgi:hypothetical protein
MKKMFFIVGTALIVMTFISSGNAYAGREGDRQIRQQERIAGGVKSGELTPGETARVETQQAHIQHVKKEMKEDGNLSLRERARLNKMQDRASRNIFRKKHNEREMN